MYGVNKNDQQIHPFLKTGCIFAFFSRESTPNAAFTPVFRLITAKRVYYRRINTQRIHPRRAKRLVLYIGGEGISRAQSVVVEETRNAVLGARAKKPLFFKGSSCFGRPKIRKKLSKNILHSICSMYIIQRLVKREEAGSYRASG